MILSLQYLRAVAALMVVAFHAADAFARLSGTEVSFPVGVAGVDVFFVISGFVMGYTTAGRDPSPLGFLWKRILRIVPLYWFLTLLVANVAILRPDLLSSTVFEGRHFLASLFFWPVIHPSLEETFPLLIPGWTLNYEMAFYTLVALSLTLPRRVRLTAVLAVLVAAVALRGLLPYRVATAFYTMPLILEFGAGLVIARAYGAASTVRSGLAAFTFAAGAIALVAMADAGLWRSLAAGLPAALLVSGAVFFERRRPLPRIAALKLLGDVSYALYLVHVLAIPVLALGWRMAGLPLSPAGGMVFLALALAASSLAGIVLHLLVERPLLLLLRASPARPSGSPLAAA